jgi:hypothetical protein
MSAYRSQQHWTWWAMRYNNIRNYSLEIWYVGPRCKLCAYLFWFVSIWCNPYLTWSWGRAIAQAASRWLPTAAAQVRVRGLFMWDLWWTKWHWSRFSPSTSVFLPILIPPTAPHSSIIRGGYNRPVSGRSTKWTQLHSIPRNLKIIIMHEPPTDARKFSQKSWS